MSFRAGRLILFLMCFQLLGDTAPALDTVWNFDGNLNADYGSGIMNYRGNTESFTSFGTTASYGLPSIYGDNGTAKIMSFPATDPYQGYTINYGSNDLVEEYTIVWDVLFPESSDCEWRALYQTNMDNNNYADLYVRNAPSGGIGIVGQYHGAVIPGEWNRIAITRDTSCKLSKYINGGYVGEQDASDSRWTIGDNIYHIFTDMDNDTEHGYIASHRFVDHAMTQQEIYSLGGVNAGGASVAGELLSDPSHFEPGSFTIAVFGDTQSYVKNDVDAQIFNQMSQWIVDNKENRNIQFVTHVGDIVDSNTTEQWSRADTALTILEGEIPYALASGNHDYGNSRSISEFDYFYRYGVGSFYALQPTLDGYYPAEPRSRMNTYHTFSAGNQDFLVLALEFGPRDDVVAWAETVVNEHPNHRVILLTHGYMFDGGMWFDHTVDPNDPQGRTHDQVRNDMIGYTGGLGNPHSYDFVSSDCNDGKELWDKLVKDHQNFSMVLSGHQFDERDGFQYLHTQGKNGNDVYQMLFNTQTRESGGEGWMRLLEFSPDGKTVTIKTYSPLLDQWSYASDEYYTIELSPIQTIPGDANNDGKVDGSDVTILAGNWQYGVTGTANATWQMGDFNGDGKIDGSDVTILAGNWQYGVEVMLNTVPEPSTFALLLTFVLLMNRLIVRNRTKTI